MPSETFKNSRTKHYKIITPITPFLSFGSSTTCFQGQIAKNYCSRGFVKAARNGKSARVAFLSGVRAQWD
jgi:hypothetical protein